MESESDCLSCGSVDVRLMDSGETWKEFECLDCGTIYFHDHE